MCEFCQAELEFEFEDTYEGAYGSRYIKCPVCGKEIMAYDIEGIELTENNIEFPKHFYHMGPNAVDIEDKQIQSWVREGLQRLKDNRAVDFYFHGTGNSFVIILEMNDEYLIYVMKNYWEMEIPKDKE
jgi:DNA-directed RNA polymerase subunit RPC12/RpoP